MLLALGTLLCGCVAMLPAPTPMRTIDYAQGPQPAKCLFVLLPGAGDRVGTFEKRGFIEEVRAAGRSIDIRATDATLGYYLKQSFPERFSADVIAPAKARGYEEVWLMGPSMGGFGSLFYSRLRAADVTGVLAIAPYLGAESLTGEIAAAGGLKNWRAPARAEPGRDDYQRELWRWLQAVTQGQEAGPMIFAGYGTADKFAAADSLLAAALPPARVFRTSGKHEWSAWRRVLASFLASPEFAPHCRVEPAHSSD
jgi:pimeloyl-ACP methyl ester carboxylesterase